MKTQSAERPQLCLGKRAERQGRARALSWKGLQVLSPPLREVVRARAPLAQKYGPGSERSSHGAPAAGRGLLRA